MIRVSRSDHFKFPLSLPRTVIFGVPEEIGSAELFGSPTEVNPWFKHHESLRSQNVLNDYSDPPTTCKNDPAVQIREPYEEDGRVKTYFTAECEADVLPPHDRIVEVTLIPPPSYAERDGNSPEYGPSV